MWFRPKPPTDDATPLPAPKDMDAEFRWMTLKEASLRKEAELERVIEQLRREKQELWEIIDRTRAELERVRKEAQNGVDIIAS